MPSLPINRRTATAGLCGLLLSPLARADRFPSRPIRIMVGFAAGGSTDALARIYAQKLGEVLGATVIVENKPGALQLVAAKSVMTAAPDGYTLWVTSSSALTQTPGVRSDTPFDPLKDFTPLAKVADAEAIFAVRSDLGHSSVRDLIAFARANPGKLNYGSAGVGSGNHLLTEYLKVLTGTNITHIPYKSDPDVVRELIGGTVDIGITVANAILPHAQNPKLKLIAVTGTARMPVIPEVPTLAESGVSELSSVGTYLFYGILGPARMPAELVKTLNDAITTASKSPEVIDKLGKQSFKPTTSTPSEFRDLIARELVTWKRVGKSVKLDATNS